MGRNAPAEFIVSGIGRSGTTLMAHALSLHPNVLCTIEQTNHKFDHTGLFRDPGHLIASGNPRHLDLNLARLAKKDPSELAAVGNKWPNYFFRWDGVLSELKDPRAIVMVRHPFEVMASANTRMAKGKWPVGLLTAFTLVDLVEMMRRAVLSRFADNTCFVDYGYFAFSEQRVEIFASTLSFIGVEQNPATERAFIGLTGRDAPPKPVVSSNERRLVELADFSELLSIMRDGRFVTASAIADAIPPIVDRVLASGDEFFDIFADMLREQAELPGEGVRVHVAARLRIEDSMLAQLIHSSQHPLARVFSRARTRRRAAFAAALEKCLG